MQIYAKYGVLFFNLVKLEYVQIPWGMTSRYLLISDAEIATFFNR